MQRLTALLLSFLVPTAIAHPNEIYRILDPLAVPVAGNPAQAIVSVQAPRHVTRIRCDVVIAGGGLGGVATALASLRSELHVCLTEETNWLGG